MDSRPHPVLPVSVEPDQHILVVDNAARLPTSPDRDLVEVFGRLVVPLSAAPPTPRAPSRSRSPPASSSHVVPLVAAPATSGDQGPGVGSGTRRGSPTNSSGESHDESESGSHVLAVSVFEYIDICSSRFHKLLLREDGKVKMLSYGGLVRDSNWHGCWTRAVSGRLDISVSCRGSNEQRLSIQPPELQGFGLRVVLRDGLRKAVVNELLEKYYYNRSTEAWVGASIE